MIHKHWNQIFSWDVESEELGDFVNSVSDLWLLVQDHLVNDLSQNFVDKWLDFSLNTNDQVVKLIKRLFLQVDLK